MKIIFTSVECYPAAKVGGLADVVGALPKYLTEAGHEVTVIMPKYDLPWITNLENKTISKKGSLKILDTPHSYTIEEIATDILGFRLVFVNIPDLFFRKGVYADAESRYFTDEAERYTAYDRVVLDWISDMKTLPDIVHCHDHHTALIPFMMATCHQYESLRDIPTVLTIHNEKYRGRFAWQKSYLIPDFDQSDRGLLDWDHAIDPLASAIKCSWRVTTVSPSYMIELLEAESDLKPLFLQEREKCIGLINGIDKTYWDPTSDPMIKHKLTKDPEKFKSANKKHLCKMMGLDEKLPLISFIGRLANEKGADLIPGAIDKILSKKKKDTNFLILGTGMSSLEDELVKLGRKYPKHLSVHIMYDEALAHQIYASSDFLLMPSRVEPCGLNQMYALRYGTIPVVRSIGGLKDTVIDIKYKNGNGVRFENADSTSIIKACKRVKNLYENKERMAKIRARTFTCDFSWDASAAAYLSLYNDLLK